MSINSINTNIAALRAQENIGAANRASTSSIARLSSGERIVRAADDVASMSAGTSLRTNVTTLKTALINTAQGSSMLQVADGALGQITDILLRQKAIAVQAGAGSLSASERSFLNQEFQNLTAEIDRLATQTNFNGVNLLDGSVLSASDVETATTRADQAEARITLTGAVPAGDTLVINGTTITAVAAGTPIDPAGVSFEEGADLATSVGRLLDYLQNSTQRQVSQFTYELEGPATIVVRSAEGGIIGQKNTVSGTLTNGAVTAGAGNRLIGGANNGLVGGATTATGTIGDSIIYTQNQNKAAGRIIFNSAVTFDTATVANNTFAFGGLTVTGGAANTGANFALAFQDDGTTVDVKATIDNVVSAFMRQQATANNYELNQVDIYREGFDLVFRNKSSGELLQADFATAATGIGAVGGATGTTTVNGTLAQTGDRETGINTNAVSNEAFVGRLSGFNVTYVAEDQVNISLTVGGRTYTADDVNVAINNITDIANTLGAGAETRIADTTPAVRLKSSEGDYFDIDLMGARENLNVSNQSDANNLAGRLDAALSTMTFYQERAITNFNPIGGASASVRLSNFDNFRIGDISVTAATTEASNARVSLNAGGEIFQIESMGDDIRAGSVLRFVSTDDPERYVLYRHGQTSFALNTTAGAESFEEYLRTAFRVGADGAGASFQVGVTTTDTIKVSIGVANTNKLFAGQSINVLTQDAAATASNALDGAIDMVTSLRADVGAMQSRFDFASANIESSLQNQDAARGVLLDTDISAESTAFATAQVQLQAGISVLAQANLLSQNLLKLIG